MTRPSFLLSISAIGLAASWGCSSTERIGDCDGSIRSIHDVQGTGSASPLAGHDVVVRGIVVGDFQGEERLRGFFLQEPKADNDPRTSEGLFVFSPQRREVAIGDLVQVAGRVEEHSGLTELTAVASVKVCRSGATVSPTPLSLGEEDLETHEGMLVVVEDLLTVADNHELGSAGQLLVAPGGRPFHVTNSPVATSPVANSETVAASIEPQVLLVDDGRGGETSSPPPFLDSAGTRRVGDTVQRLIGVITEADGSHALLPTVPPQFENVNPRPSAPAEVGGTARVASFNLLNFFSTLGERGATSTAELERQSAKHVAAIEALDADIVGLIELENTGDAAIQVLLDALNAEAGDSAWAVVALPADGLGDDTIRVGMIYRPEAVAPVGSPIADHDPVFKRPPLAQTFEVQGERFTVVVSHFKSKRCGDAEGTEQDADDGQGCWNALRTRQAGRLVELVSELQSASGDPDVLVLGDLNAYGAEDPIRALTEGHLVDLVAAHVEEDERYSYVYDGTSGYLDHALTTPDFSQRVTGVAFWHINSDEPPFLDYKTDQSAELYRPDPYRSSDHDPVLIGLDL